MRHQVWQRLLRRYLMSGKLPPVISRRVFLAAPLIGIPYVARAAGAVFDADVIVIGAGAAGLAAAHELLRLKRKVIVLEARGRVGGRIFTDHSLGAPYDAGAFYIHWAEKNSWTRIARLHGVKTLDEDEVQRNGRSFDRGTPPASPDGVTAWDKLRERLDDSKARIADISMLEFAGGEKAAAAEGALTMARLALGDEAERVSARDYARLWAGDDRLVPDGFGTILERYAKGLDIRLNTPVNTIDWGGRGVRVTTPDGTINARSVVVSVPVGALQSGSIKFTPGLPSINVAGLQGLGMGASTRMALRFDGARFGLAPHTNVRLRLSARQSFSFGCFDWNRDLVTVYFGGDHAREVIAMGQEPACAHVLDQFAGVMGNDVRQHYIGGRLNGWWNDPWSCGAYSHALPGRANAREQLAEPVGARIFFAGEATGGTGGSGAAITAGGAYLSGIVAARKAAKTV